MDRAQFGRLEEIFYEALEISPADRVFHLRQRCGDDSRLLKTIQELLEAAQQCELAVRRQETSQPCAELPQFGVFQAERVLGRGGAGVVYLARRTDGQFEQLVAVKTIQSDIAAAPIREGFLHERRILAGLRHPNIAQVLDGGIGSDQAPYLVMEYVEGERLDDYCNRSRLTVLARVALMRAVCEAVSFAHRNLIVHLDLKPSNILVDAQGHPKLLDFGTAKILAGADAKVTQALATPRYASPEQIRGERAGVLSDIYSLGVILAELVSGRWPFGDPESRVDTLRRVIEDVMPTALAESVTPEHADRCGTPLKELRRTLKSDLSAIVSKALETDPERRYRSVDELCADLECFADGLPVLARPQTRRYRAAKFVKRHPWNVALAGLFVLGMTAAVVFSQHQAEIARRQAVRAQHISVFLEDLLGSPNPNWYNTLRKKAKDITIAEVSRPTWLSSWNGTR